MAVKFDSEEQLARPVAAYLARCGWDVYQEVQLRRRGPVADLVAVQGETIWVVEVKRTLSLGLLEQAVAWRDRAHRVAIAVPGSQRRPRGAKLAGEILCWQGLGWLQVWQRQGPRGQPPTAFVREKLAPDHCDGADVAVLRGALRPEQRTWAAAGNASAQRWTPFQQTAQNVIATVTAAPGLTTGEVVDRIDHHYPHRAAAVSALREWARQGVIRGVVARKEHGRVRLYPLADQQDPDSSGPTDPGEGEAPEATR